MRNFKWALIALFMLVSVNANATHFVRQKDDGSAVVEDSSGNVYLRAYNGGLDTSGITHSTSLFKNPPVQGGYQSLTSASVGAGATLLTGETGKVIKLRNIHVFSAGAAAGATTITVECSGGTDLLAIPVSLLTDGRVVGPLTSAPSATAQSAFATSALVTGCPASQNVVIGKTGGTITGSTAFGVTYEYTYQ